MKAYEIRSEFGFDHLKCTERPDPHPGPGQVLIRLRAVSVNYRDLMVVQGRYNPKMSLPRVPFSDGAGEIVSLGENVTTWKVGDRVVLPFFPGWLEGELTKAKAATALGGDVDGTLRELITISAEIPLTIPSCFNFEQAATLPCAAVTAWQGLFEAGSLAPGQTVLIQGTGGVSLFGLQLAKAAGAEVILLSGSDEKLARAAKFGAHHSINYKTTPDWEKTVLGITEGRGVDVTLEVGGSGTLNKTLRATRHGGRVSLIGVLTGRGGEIDIAPLLHKAIQVDGIYVGSRAMFERLNQALELHQIAPEIDHIFAFEQVVEALKKMEYAGHFGKLVVQI